VLLWMNVQWLMQVCKDAGVELHVVPLTDEYWDRVVAHSIAEIKAGRTPNPDILCNSRCVLHAKLIGSNVHCKQAKIHSTSQCVFGSCVVFSSNVRKALHVEGQNVKVHTVAFACQDLIGWPCLYQAGNAALGACLRMESKPFWFGFLQG